MGVYKTGQVCLNGHIITGNIQQKERCSKFCVQCGAETITCCQSCNENIRGNFTYEHVSGEKMNLPLYCHNCGEPYPWTVDALESARILIDEESELSKEEKENLKKSLPDLLSETPRTSLAVSRVKRAMMSVGGVLKDALVQFAAAFACEAAKSSLGIK